MVIYKDKNGNYVREENGKQFVVGQNDARYGKLGQEYSQQEASNKGTLTYNQADGSYTRNVGGVGYNVLRDDPRYGSMSNEYTTQNGGMAATGTVNKPSGYENYQGILGQYKDAQTRAAQGQIDAAVNRLGDSIGNANQQYDKAASDLYVGKRVAERNMGQQLAGIGLGQTGVAESTVLGNEQNYLTNLNQSEQARQQAIQAIENQIAEIQAGGASTMADIEANYGSQLGNGYLNLLGSDRNQWNSDRDYRSTQEQWDYTKQQNAQSLQAGKYDTLLSMGAYSPELAQYLGISPEYLKNLLARK